MPRNRRSELVGIGIVMIYADPIILFRLGIGKLDTNLLFSEGVAALVSVDFVVFGLAATAGNWAKDITDILSFVSDAVTVLILSDTVAVEMRMISAIVCSSQCND